MQSITSILWPQIRGKFLPPRPPPKQERRQLLAVAFQMNLSEDPAQSCVGLRHKIQITSCWGFCSGNFPLVSLRLWSCAGASTTHLGCSHDAKEDQASDTAHIHRCLASEILGRILMWDHLYNPTVCRAEKLYSITASPLDRDWSCFWSCPRQTVDKGPGPASHKAVQLQYSTESIFPESCLHFGPFGPASVQQKAAA